MEYKDYYQVLGVDKKADEKEIKRAFRRLARQYHPDKNPNDKKAEDKFKEINEAYEVLGSADNRAKYDQLGQSYQRYRQMGGSPGNFDFSQWFSGGAPAGANYQRVNVDFEDLLGGSGGNFSDFFSSIFGNMNRGGPRSPAGPRTPEQTVAITLEEAYQGTTRTFSGDGERFTAKIPKGADTGSKIRLRGKGSPGPAGTPTDLVLLINLEPHPTFSREGQDLKTEIEVDVLTAILGGKATVPTLTGPVTLTIPAGTQNGRTFRLRGKGMPNLQTPDQYGDLLAQIKVSIPEQLSDEERRLYEQLAQYRR